MVATLREDPLRVLGAAGVFADFFELVWGQVDPPRRDPRAVAALLEDLIEQARSRLDR